MRPNDPVRRWTLILGLIVVLFFYSMIADRMTPYTSQATVQTFVVRMAPEVAGRVIEVNVVDNQRVKAGDVLFRIDARPFTIAHAQAEARLAGVGQTIGASTAAVTSAQERMIEAEAKRDNARAETILAGGRVSPQSQELTRPRSSRSPKLLCARRLQGRARQAEPPKETTIRSAGARCGRAASSTSRFRPPMAITNTPTHRRNSSPWYCLTFIIDTVDRANSGEQRRMSRQAIRRTVLDTLPGRVFDAKVQSIGWGVSQGSSIPSRVAEDREPMGWCGSAALRR
jgi:multidrug efflux pump subunit AcrA (membrane-fusion protein)